MALKYRKSSGQKFFPYHVLPRNLVKLLPQRTRISLLKTVLCHVGLAKCGSTILQNAWARSTNHSLDKCEGLVEGIKEIVLSNPDGLTVLSQTLERAELNTDVFENAPGQYGVVSNEAITSHSYPSAFHYDDLSKRTVESFAAVLAPYVDRVLLVIRNPFSLLVSSYCQDIKEGASHSFETFMSTRRPDMLANLDLVSIVRAFSKIDARITVLPIELLAGTEGIFWAEYERRLRLPKPNVDLLLSDPLAANSTRRETIPLHRQINAILSELEGVVTLHEWPEGETLLEALSCSRLWSVRRALSVIDEDQVTRLAAMLGVPERQACTTFEFDPDFIEVLREQFMSPLECSELFPYKDVLTNYKTSLDVGVVETI